MSTNFLDMSDDEFMKLPQVTEEAPIKPAQENTDTTGKTSEDDQGEDQGTDDLGEPQDGEVTTEADRGLARHAAHTRYAGDERRRHHRPRVALPHAR